MKNFLTALKTIIFLFVIAPLAWFGIWKGYQWYVDSYDFQGQRETTLKAQTEKPTKEELELILSGLTFNLPKYDTESHYNKRLSNTLFLTYNEPTQQTLNTINENINNLNKLIPIASEYENTLSYCYNQFQLSVAKHNYPDNHHGKNNNNLVKYLTLISEWDYLGICNQRYKNLQADTQE